MTRWYPIECEHGHDACPICDATTYPSGARATTKRRPGLTEFHLELPHHEGDILDRLALKNQGESR